MYKCICIKHISFYNVSNNYIKGKVYNYNFYNKNTVQVRDEYEDFTGILFHFTGSNGGGRRIFSDYFITLDEYRNRKINNLLK